MGDQGEHCNRWPLTHDDVLSDRRESALSKLHLVFAVWKDEDDNSGLKVIATCAPAEVLV